MPRLRHQHWIIAAPWNECLGLDTACSILQLQLQHFAVAAMAGERSLRSRMRCIDALHLDPQQAPPRSSLPRRRRRSEAEADAVAKAAAPADPAADAVAKAVARPRPLPLPTPHRHTSELWRLSVAPDFDAGSDSAAAGSSGHESIDTDAGTTAPGDSVVHLGPANSALLQSLGIEHLAGDSVVHLGTANSALLQSLGIILPMPTEHAQSSGSAYRRRAAGRSDSEVPAAAGGGRRGAASPGGRHECRDILQDNPRS